MRNILTYIGFGIISAAFASVCYSAETKVPLKDLPPAVSQTVADLSKGATLKQVVREMDNGKTVYEAQLTANGHKRDVSISENGTVLATEETVTLTDIPASVRTAMEKAAGEGKIKRVESVTAADHSVTYEGAVVTNGKKSEIRVDSQGMVLPAE